MFLHPIYFFSACHWGHGGHFLFKIKLSSVICHLQALLYIANTIILFIIMLIMVIFENTESRSHRVLFISLYLLIT